MCQVLKTKTCAPKAHKSYAPQELWDKLTRNFLCRISNFVIGFYRKNLEKLQQEEKPFNHTVGRQAFSR
jgi:hypothetical protein